MAFEFQILDWIQTLRTPAMDVLMPLITRFGDGGIFWICLSLVLLRFPKTRRCGILALLALVIEVIPCNLILKPLVARIRPCDINTAVQLLIRRPSDFSFPSGHTSASFAVAAAYFLGGDRRPAWPSLVLAALVAFSRLYLYVHYPTDVAAGIVIGVAAAFAARTVWLRWGDLISRRFHCFRKSHRI